MTRIRAKVPNVAPQTWLCAQLGVSRQIVYLWEKDGFPEKHAPHIAELLGMDPIQVCPTLLSIALPERVFDAVVAATTPKKPFLIKMVELIKLGLKWEKEPEVPETKPKSRPKPETPMPAKGGFIPISADELASQRAEAVKAGADISIKGRSR